MKEFAPRIRQATQTIKNELSGSTERHNGQLFPSAIINEPQVTPFGSTITDIELQEGAFGERAHWTSTNISGMVRRRYVVLDEMHGSMSVTQEILDDKGEVAVKFVYPVRDSSDTPYRPYYPGASDEIMIPEYRQNVVLTELETAVDALRRRNTSSVD